jgi:hypothetical protein
MSPRPWALAAALLVLPHLSWAQGGMGPGVLGRVTNKAGKPEAAPSPTQSAPAAAVSVTDADSTAAFKAAGFKLDGGNWKSDCGDPGTASYTPGSIEVDDVNKDGRPELWITESSSYCYGNTGVAFWLMAKNPDGGWALLINDTGVHGALATVRHGWPDIEVGGPGTGKFPFYKFEGRKYVRSN